MALIDKIAQYQELLVRKEQLADATKSNNKALEQMKQEIADQMIDEECPVIGYQGYNFSLQTKTVYSKKSEAELMAGGLDFLGTLRQCGLGDLIVEKVDPRTLSSALKNMVEEDGVLPDELAEVVNVYETTDIGRRKRPK